MPCIVCCTAALVPPFQSFLNQIRSASLAPGCPGCPGMCRVGMAGRVLKSAAAAPIHISPELLLTAHSRLEPQLIRRSRIACAHSPAPAPQSATIPADLSFGATSALDSEPATSAPDSASIAKSFASSSVLLRPMYEGIVYPIIGLLCIGRIAPTMPPHLPLPVNPAGILPPRPGLDVAPPLRPAPPCRPSPPPSAPSSSCLRRQAPLDLYSLITTCDTFLLPS